MHPQQKEAVFILSVFTVSLIVFIATALFCPFKIALASFSIFGIAGLSPYLFYRKKSKKALLDERDRKINLSSAAISGAVLWMLTVILVMFIMIIKKFSGDVCMPAYFLGYLLIAGSITIYVTRSISVLVLYHRGVPHE
jgi:hypothetical protein